MINTLISVNLNLLNEYEDWKKANKDWNISDYLYLNYNMNTAIAFGKLYFPDFIEKDGCIILNFRYNENTFLAWKKHFNNDIKGIEFKCNFFEVKDYFNYTKDNYESLDAYNIALDEFAKILKKSWEKNLKLLYPNREMIVDVWDEYNTTRITLFTNNPN